MKHRFQVYISIFLVLTACAALLCSCNGQDLTSEGTISGSDTVSGQPSVDAPEITLCFCSRKAVGANIICPHKSDGTYYVFLPSYANPERIRFCEKCRGDLVIDNEAVTGSTTCALYDFSAIHTIKRDGKKSGLRFMQSANVATLFVDTGSGKMTAVDSDKDYEEDAKYTLLGADGSIETEVIGVIEGRGNYTWELAKKPYLITLPERAGFLGMNPAKKWVLLANATDAAALNNKIVSDMANAVGFEYAPKCEYVDLYLNGKYNGLYLISEKAEIDSERLDLDKASGDFLAKVDLTDRWNTLNNPFTSSLGRTVELTEPERPTDREREQMMLAVNRMESAVLAGNFDIIDIDSWAKRYLIDEISGNIDSDLCSSYFYSKGGVFYAGPVWDYDMAFGNSPVRNSVPQAFIARYGTGYGGAVYYPALYNNERFYSRMVEIYESEFLPFLNELTETGIDERAEMLASATKMNAQRWSNLFYELHTTVVNKTTASSVKRYINERVEFLNSTWLDGVEYCTVQFDLGAYMNISVKKGEVLSTDAVDLRHTEWFIDGSGKRFDPSKPVTEERIFLHSWKPW